MTTIAANFRLGVMAADKKESYGSGGWPTTKIHKIDGKLVGVAGTSTHGQKFLKWLRDPSVLPEYKTEEGDFSFAALVMNDDGLFYYDKELTPLRIEQEFAAVGTGMDAALAAMYMGAHPKRAVEIASMIDSGTGFGIDVLKMTRKPIKAGRKR